jgi:hypothetical protein
MPDHLRRPTKRLRRPKAEDPKDVAAHEADVSVSVLPMEIQVGDCFDDSGYEWEVVDRPEVLHGAKNLRARSRRPGVPETERDMTWPAHVRIKISRGAEPAAE